MSAAVVEHVAVDEEVARRAPADPGTLRDGLDDLIERGVAALRAEIPAYRDGDERFVDDLRDQVRAHYSVKLDGAARGPHGHPATTSRFVRAAATRRARAGFALEDYLNAFRVGQQAFWEAVLDCAGETPLGHEAALTLAGPLMRYCDFASTHAAHAYVEYQQYMVADADRERRDLLEHLLAGEMPTRSPLLAAAQAYGITADARMLVATAVTVDARDDDAPHVGSAAIACAGLHDAKTLVVVRQAEIVAVLVARRRRRPVPDVRSGRRAAGRLRREGVALAMGVSTVATGVGDLPRAYKEAHVALAGVGDDGGVAALARLTPFDYLALRADDTARRLVNPRLRAFLDEDRRRGGVLTATIRARRRRRPQPARRRRAPAGPPQHRAVPPAPHRGAHRAQPAPDRRPARPARRDRARRRARAGS